MCSRYGISKLHIRLDLDPPHNRTIPFQADPAIRAHLGTQLLLYDRIAIPTYDFGIVPVLISWMGLKIVRMLLESGSLVFLRRLGLLSYLGNRNGLATFVVHAGPDREFSWWQIAMFGSSSESIEAQLRANCGYLGKKERDRFIQLVLANTVDATIDSAVFTGRIERESYTDIMESPGLKQKVLALAAQPSGTPLDLQSLPGIDPNQMRVLGNGGLKTAIDVVLRVAEINFEFLMADLVDDADLLTSDGAEHVILEKIRRVTTSSEVLEGFFQLLNLVGMPDVRPAIAADELTLADITAFRRKRRAKQFRKWLRDLNVSDARDIERSFATLLTKYVRVDKLPKRAVKVAITTGLGIANPIAGIAASTTDSFLLDKFRRGYRPWLFLDELNRLLLK